MGIYIIIGIIGALWAAAIANAKRLDPAGYAILGFLLPLVGFIVAHVAKTEPPAEGAS